MKTIEEIMFEAGQASHVGSCVPILGMCRELAAAGRFREMAAALCIWVKFAPQSAQYVKAVLPSIVLESYLTAKNILTFEQYYQWIWSSPMGKWGEQIRESVLDEDLLFEAVHRIEASMRQFAEAPDTRPKPQMH